MGDHTNLGNNALMLANRLARSPIPNRDELDKLCRETGGREQLLAAVAYLLDRDAKLSDTEVSTVHLLLAALREHIRSLSRPEGAHLVGDQSNYSQRLG